MPEGRKSNRLGSDSTGAVEDSERMGRNPRGKQLSQDLALALDGTVPVLKDEVVPIRKRFVKTEDSL
jgi:hypothetical protein